MKAFYNKAYGAREVSEYGELPDPVPGAGEMIVEVKAVSINPVDYKVRKGIAGIVTGSKFPKVFGSDFAGIIKEPCMEHPEYKKGDKVYGAISAFSGRQGSLSELVAVKYEMLRHMPEKMSFEDAAALPVASLTALNGLRQCGVKEGTKLLINGATGGVGHFAVQIAKAKGAHVTATCSMANSDFAKTLGAEETSGYSRQDLVKITNKFEAILDAYGKMEKTSILHLLKTNGTYASPLLFPVSFLPILFFRVFLFRKLKSSNMRALPEDYQEIENLYLQGKLKPHIDAVFTLDKAEDAFELAEKGRPKGKVVVNL